MFVDPYEEEEDEFWPEPIYGQVCCEQERVGDFQGKREFIVGVVEVSETGSA